MTPGVILNTRPPTYHTRFHAAFAPLGWPIVDSPVLVPEKVAAELPAPDGFDAVIFTSQVAIDMLGGGAWRDKTAYVVGPATAEAAREAGYSRVIQTGLDAKDMMARLSVETFARALYPSAEDVSADIASDDPARVRRMPIYRMTPAAALSAEAATAVRAGGPIVVPLFSRRSAGAIQRLLTGARGGGREAFLCAVAISAQALGNPGAPWQRWAVADKPTLEAVVATTAAMVAELNSGTRA